MKIRQIKPEFWTSPQVVGASRDARLLFIGLWNLADDGGRYPISPRRIQLQLFPADLDLDVTGCLRELEQADLIYCYDVDGRGFLQITGWHHQESSLKYFVYRYPRPDGITPKSGKSKDPSPVEKASKNNRLQPSGQISPKVTPIRGNSPDSGGNDPDSGGSSPDSGDNAPGKSPGSGSGSGSWKGLVVGSSIQDEEADASSSCSDVNESDADDDGADNAPSGEQGKPKRARLKFTDDDMKAARYIWGRVKAVTEGKAKPPRLESWANDVRLAREADGRTLQELCEVMRWASNDEFWSTVILSAAKLRAKFGDLYPKMRKAARQQEANRRTVETVADEAIAQAERIRKLKQGGG